MAEESIPHRHSLNDLFPRSKQQLSRRSSLREIISKYCSTNKIQDDDDESNASSTSTKSDQIQAKVIEPDWHSHELHEHGSEIAQEYRTPFHTHITAYQHRHQPIYWTTKNECEVIHLHSIFHQSQMGCKSTIRKMCTRTYRDRFYIGGISWFIGVGMGLGDAVYSVWYWALLIFVMGVSMLGYLTYISMQQPELKIIKIAQYQQQCIDICRLINFQLTLDSHNRTDWNYFITYIHSEWRHLLNIANTIQIKGNPWNFKSPAILHQFYIPCNLDADKDIELGQTRTSP